MLTQLVTGKLDASAIAIVRSSGETVTAGALRAEVARTSEQLARAGAGPGRPVAVASTDPRWFIVAALAAWDAGAPVVPLDARGSDALAMDLARRAHAAVVARLDGDGIAISRSSWEASPLDPRVALVLFTSGSAAEPKGVLLSREGLEANVRAILDYLPIARAPRTAVVVPLSYSYGLVGQVLTTLHAGGTLVLLGDLPYPALQVEAMHRLGAQGLSTVPASLRLLARAAIATPVSQRPVLAYVGSAGAPFDTGTVDLVREAFPGARLFNQYGLTEASPRVTALDDSSAAFARGSVGRALQGIEIWACSAEGQRLAPGVEGELVVRGPSVMLGYLDDPAGTRRVLSPDGVLRTGDAGTVDAEGFVFVTGRLDGVVKCAGERVSVEEIAAALRTVPGVRDACVVAVPHPELGASLHAYVEAAGERLPAIRVFVRERFTPAKRPVKIVALDALPRTANGKIAIGALTGGSS
jgi:long-chain acyl-CoA synthetase